MSRRSDLPQASAGIPVAAESPPQAQVEAAIARVIEAVVPKRSEAERQGGALKRAEEIGRADRPGGSRTR